MEFLKLENIRKVYREGKIETEVLKGINLVIEKGIIASITGPSGSGKSTLMHIIGTLDSPSSGSIFFEGQDLTSMSEGDKSKFRNTHLGFVYQFHHLLFDFTAMENVMMPLLISKVPQGEAEKTAREYLERVGLGDRMNFMPQDLSGGQRQRVAIARALCRKPSLVLADEPTGNLDEENAASVFTLFKDLVKKEGCTLVLVTHDSALASQTDKVFTIKNGILA